MNNTSFHLQLTPAPLHVRALLLLLGFVVVPILTVIIAVVTLHRLVQWVTANNAVVITLVGAVQKGVLVIEEE